MKERASVQGIPMFGTASAYSVRNETGSLTKAARVLGITPEAVSRSVMRLEGAVGITLLRHTTRSLSRMDCAQRYQALCAQALELLAAGERELSVERDGPEGLVRMSVPPTYGHHRLLPSLSAFRESYPGVRPYLHVSNHNVDFVRNSFDVAIRMGRVKDLSLVATAARTTYSRPSPWRGRDSGSSRCTTFWSRPTWPGARSWRSSRATEASRDHSSLVYPRSMKPGGAGRALIDFVVSTAKTRASG